MDDPLAVSYQRHFDDVYRFVRRRATAADAEDLTQEVFAAAAVALADARVEAPPPLAWLYTVARRRLVDLGRRRASSDSSAADDRTAEERTYGPQVGRALADAFARLTDAQRRVIVLKLFDGARSPRSPLCPAAARAPARCASPAVSRPCVRSSNGRGSTDERRSRSSLDRPRARGSPSGRSPAGGDRRRPPRERRRRGAAPAEATHPARRANGGRALRRSCGRSGRAVEQFRQRQPRRPRPGGDRDAAGVARGRRACPAGSADRPQDRGSGAAERAAGGT